MVDVGRQWPTESSIAFGASVAQTPSFLRISSLATIGITDTKNPAIWTCEIDNVVVVVVVVVIVVQYDAVDSFVLIVCSGIMMAIVKIDYLSSQQIA